MKRFDSTAVKIRSTQGPTERRLQLNYKESVLMALATPVNNVPADVP